MNSRQEPGTPVDRSPRRQAARVGEDDERRKIVGLTPQAVGRPGAKRRESGEDEAAVGHEHRRPMERRLGMHRMEEGDRIDMPGQAREQIAHPPAAFPVLPERPSRRHALPRPRGEKLELPIGIKRHAGPTNKLRLVVKRVDVAHPPRTEDLDHRRGPRLKTGRPWRQRPPRNAPGGGRGGRKGDIESEGAEPAAEGTEKRATARRTEAVARGGSGKKHRINPWTRDPCQSIADSSLAASIIRQNCTSPACATRSMPAAASSRSGSRPKASWKPSRT